jgi:hypothetical protein
LCAKVSCWTLGVDDQNNLLDYAFCEIEFCEEDVTNKLCGSEVVLRKTKSTLDYKTESKIHVYKVGRTTGYTKGIMCNRLVLMDVFEGDVKALIAHSDDPGSKFGKLLIIKSCLINLSLLHIIDIIYI